MQAELDGQVLLTALQHLTGRDMGRSRSCRGLGHGYRDGRVPRPVPLLLSLAVRESLARCQCTYLNSQARLGVTSAPCGASESSESGSGPALSRGDPPAPPACQ